MDITTIDSLACACRKCAAVHRLIDIATESAPGRFTMRCPDCGLESPARCGKPAFDFFRFLDRVGPAMSSAADHGFALSGWEISNENSVLPSIYAIEHIGFQHACGKSFRMNGRQLEAAADTPAKFRCNGCHAGMPAKDARELMVSLRYVRRGFDEIQHGFMPDLFSCAGLQFRPDDYVFPIYQGSARI